MFVKISVKHYQPTHDQTYHHSLDINPPVRMSSLLPSKTMSEELCLMAVACAITIVKQKYRKNKNRRKKECKD
jgi:hypothetical protein